MKSKRDGLMALYGIQNMNYKVSTDSIESSIDTSFDKSTNGDICELFLFY